MYVYDTYSFNESIFLLHVVFTDRKFKSFSFYFFTNNNKMNNSVEIKVYTFDFASHKTCFV